MKWLVLLILVVAVAYDVLGQTYVARDRERETMVTVPNTLSKVFNELAPGADSINWEHRSYQGEEYYEVYFNQQSQVGWVTFEPDGSLNNCMTAAKMGALPPAVRQAVARKMAGHFWSVPAPVAVISRYFHHCALASHSSKKCASITFMVGLYLSEKGVRQGEEVRHFNVSPEGRITRPKLPRRMK